MRAPVTFAYRNLVFGRDMADAWALYRIATTSYDGLSVAGKKRLLGLVSAFAYTIEADFQILRVSRGWSIDEYEEGARRLFDPEFGHEAAHEKLLAAHRRVLEQRDVRRPEVYVAVRLAPPSPPRNVNGLLGTSTACWKQRGGIYAVCKTAPASLATRARSPSGASRHSLASRIRHLNA